MKEYVEIFSVVKYFKEQLSPFEQNAVEHMVKK